LAIVVGIGAPIALALFGYAAVEIGDWFYRRQFKDKP
jgi:hypothetical protein